MNHYALIKTDIERAIVEKRSELQQYETAFAFYEKLEAANIAPTMDEMVAAIDAARKIQAEPEEALAEDGSH